MKKVYCFSHQDFDKYCQDNGWSDDALPKDKCFISICGSPECQKYYLEETECHWFKKDSEQVINLDFDDISVESFDWKGHTFHGITEEQAKHLVDFILKNKGSDFYIHCRAGVSRSQGVTRFILDIFPEEYEVGNLKNPCLTPNYYVLSTLKKIFYEKFDNQN